MIMSNDDLVIRIVPVFPTEDKSILENQIFEFKGHKDRVVFIRENLLEEKSLITIDLTGLVLSWLLVKEDSKTESKFILDKKTKIIQEGTQIVSVFSRDNLVLF